MLVPRLPTYPDDFPDPDNFPEDDDPFFFDDDGDDDEAPKRWYRKPVTVIALAGLGLVAVAVPVFGLIQFFSSDSADEAPPAPTTTRTVPAATPSLPAQR